MCWVVLDLLSCLKGGVSGVSRAAMHGLGVGHP